MKKIWIHKALSFKEVEEFDLDYYLSMSPSERLDLMQYLRELYYKTKGVKDTGRKRLRRIIRVVQ